MEFILVLVVACGVLFSHAPAPAAAGDEKSVAEVLEGNEAPADSSNKRNGDISVSGGSTLAMFVKLILALAAVLFLIYALMRVIQRKTESWPGGGKIENIGGVAVGPSKSVQLVKVGNRLFLIGVGEDVQLLKEIHDKDEVDELTRRPETADGQSGRWMRFFKSPGNTSMNKKSSFIRMLNGELERLAQQQREAHGKTKDEMDKWTR